MITAIDHGLFVDVLRAIDDDAEAAGWDRDPDAYLIYDAEQAGDWYDAVAYGGTARAGRYTAVPFLPQFTLEPNAVQGLIRVAIDMHENPPTYPMNMILRTLRHPSFIGVALRFESWTVDATPEQRRAIGDTPFAEVDGAYESRDVIAATYDDAVHIVTHRRDHAARVVNDEPDVCGADGLAIRAVRIAAAAIAERPAPPDAVDGLRWVHVG